MKPADRTRVMFRLADLIEHHGDELAEIEAVDNGKPLAVAKRGIAGTAEMLRYMAGWATKLNGESVNVSVPGEWHAYTTREPVGVVGQIIPWNFPLSMAIWKIAPALATGCTRRAETRRTDTAQRAAARSDHPGSGHPGRRREYRHRLRCDGRRGARGASRCGQGRVHGVDTNGQADRSGGARQPQESVAGTGWQVTRVRLSRRGPRPRDDGRGQRHLLQQRPGVLGGLAPLRAPQGVRPGDRRRGRAWRQAEGWPRARAGQPDRPARFRASRCSVSVLISARARKRARGA